MRLDGLYLRFGEGLDERANEAARRRLMALLAAPLPGVTDLILGYTSLFIEFDRDRLGPARVRRWAEAAPEVEPSSPRTHRLPVVYDGPDLEEVARWAGRSVKEVIERHVRPSYRVFALGFTPGFPFLGVVDPVIQKPRRPTPRLQVPAHAVGIAGPQTGVYPLRSPGGWNLVGRVLERVYDPGRAAPFLLEPGDRVQFFQAEGRPPSEPEGVELLPEEPRWPFLRVLAPGLADLIVDEGRFLVGRYGLARSGPLDPYSAALANRLLGNEPGAPVLEINQRGPVLVAEAAGWVAFAGYGFLLEVDGEAYLPAQSLFLPKGARLTFRPAERGVRAYLALPGGIEHGAFFGSRSVDLKGKIGRPLAAGDRLGALRPAEGGMRRVFRPWSLPRGEVVLRIRPGPQADRASLAALTAQPFTVERADRMGLRFYEGGVPGGEVTSEGVPIGAVQVPPGGRPMLLLNDRGTLGGYAKPAVVLFEDLWRAGQLAPGDRVRFVLNFGS